MNDKKKRVREIRVEDDEVLSVDSYDFESVYELVPTEAVTTGHDKDENGNPIETRTFWRPNKDGTAMIAFRRIATLNDTKAKFVETVLYERPDSKDVRFMVDAEEPK